MIKVAVVEDNGTAAAQLTAYLERYGQENQKEFEITRFEDAVKFLDRYKDPFDLVFMDIDLPGLNGMDAAERLRGMDRRAVLIFVTNLAQFALKGYEVDALDYLIKPLQYGMFSLKLRRAVARCEEDLDSILLSQQSGYQRVLLRELCYVEVQGHKLLFHTRSEILSGAGTLAEVEEKLHGKGFLRCNKCYLVNYRYVAMVRGSSVLLKNGEELLISRPRKKSFLAELAEAMGSGNIL